MANYCSYTFGVTKCLLTWEANFVQISSTEIQVNELKIIVYKYLFSERLSLLVAAEIFQNEDRKEIYDFHMKCSSTMSTTE